MKHVERFSIKNSAQLEIRGEFIFPREGYPVIVFVHGMWGLMAEPQYQFFKEYFSERGYGVCLFDQTNGLGKSEKYGNEFLYEDAVEDLESVMNFLNEKDIDDVFFIGHSLGGGIVVDFLANYQKKFKLLHLKGAALVNPLIIAPPIKDDPQIIFRKVYKKRVPWWKRIFQMPHYSERYVEQVAHFDKRQEMKEIAVPVYIIGGEYDQTIRARELRKDVQLLQVPYEYKEFKIGHTFKHPESRSKLPEISQELYEWFEKQWNTHELQK